MDHYGPKNYTTDNGDTWVIGGKLILEDGGQLVGISGADGAYVLPAASEEALGGVKKLPNMKPFDDTDVSELKAAFNTLLSALKTAGIMAADE